MKWYIVRHADKEKGDFYNPKFRHNDQPISAKGHLEAKALCAFFAGKPVSRIFISEYIRTGQTISYVAQEKKLSPIIDERLNEVDIGVLDGVPEQEIQQRYPAVWNAFADRNRDFQYPEGETGENALHRIKSFVIEIQAQKEDIILVTHDGLIRVLLCHILDIPVYRRWGFKVDTCGIMEIEYQHEYRSWKLIRFNQKCL